MAIMETRPDVVMEEVKQTPLEILTVENAKFQKELRPGAIIRVECRETADLPGLAFQVRITDEEARGRPGTRPSGRSSSRARAG